MTPGARANGRMRPLAIFVAVAAFGVLCRLAISRTGYNQDLLSWDIVARLVREDRSVYANTFRYPYPPPGTYVLAALHWLADVLGLQGIQGFHLTVAGFLSVVDLGLGFLLWTSFGLASACFYLLNPVSVMITGYHSQLDNIGLLFGFAGWLLLRPAREDAPGGRYRASSILLGVSLAFKHVLLLYPLWVVAQEVGRGRRFREHVSYLTICYGVFFASFLAYLAAYPESWDGIQQHAFGYRGLWNYGNGLVPTSLRAACRLFGVEELGTKWPHYSTLALIMLTALGAWVTRFRPDASFFVYLVGSTLLTPSIADQYFVIPLLACAVHVRRPASWLYTTAAMTCLLYSPFNVGRALGTPVVIMHQAAQFTLLILLLTLATSPDVPKTTPLRADPARA